ncbi:olfactory receptor 5AR1-like [Alligator mississippiensis]|uniref:olfactory receptor 5AR1-like n=1 Tax=Alligator mississippiensis TaxID=8496 RepID=UPI002877BCBD|nr:olfactory receptor 5AR1-like [Alligator mississippiensis]
MANYCNSTIKDKDSFGSEPALAQRGEENRESVRNLWSLQAEVRNVLPCTERKVAATGPMDGANQTQVTEFVFLGFSRVLQGQAFVFLAFLVIYLVTLLGNCLILTLIVLDPQLHSPMYFFLGHLSILDMCYSSVTLPKILANLRHQRETISYQECMAQMFFLMTCAGAECALLTIMAFDRYVAICKPLHYTRIMSRGICILLALASWLWGILDSAIHTSLATDVSFCGANQIHHIFCDVPPLLKIACSDTYVNEITLHLASIFMGLSPFVLIIISYLYILLAILRICSNTGRRKAFSTCTSHLVVVTIYFGMANLNYNRPSSGYSLEVDTLVSTLYCILTPMLNPLIYSLRNQDVRGALRRTLRHHEKDNASPRTQPGVD